MAFSTPLPGMLKLRPFISHQALAKCFHMPNAAASCSRRLTTLALQNYTSQRQPLANTTLLLPAAKSLPHLMQNHYSLHTSFRRSNSTFQRAWRRQQAERIAAEEERQYWTEIAVTIVLQLLIYVPATYIAIELGKRAGRRNRECCCCMKLNGKWTVRDCGA